MKEILLTQYGNPWSDILDLSGTLFWEIRPRQHNGIQERSKLLWCQTEPSERNLVQFTHVYLEQRVKSSYRLCYSTQLYFFVESLNLFYSFLWKGILIYSAFQVAQWSRIHLPMQETQVWSLGPDGPLEKEMATHSSHACEILWTEEPCWLQSIGSQKSQHNVVAKWQQLVNIFIHMHTQTTHIHICTYIIYRYIICIHICIYYAYIYIYRETTHNLKLLKSIHGKWVSLPFFLQAI